MIATVLGDRPLTPLAVAMLLVLLLMVFLSNKSICGWGCQLGLLQDLLCRVPLPKWKPPFRFSNSVWVVAFVALVGELTMADTYEGKKIHADCFACGACIAACPRDDAWRET